MANPVRIPIALSGRIAQAIALLQSAQAGGGNAGGGGGAPGGQGAAPPPPPPPTPGGGAPGGPGAPPPPPGGGGGPGTPPPGPGPGTPPPPPKAPGYPWPGRRKASDPDDFFEWQGETYRPGPSGEWRRDRTREEAEKEEQRKRDRRNAFVSNTASTAIGVGLGTSLFNLPFAALQQYLEFSKVQAEVTNRFREMEAGAKAFATAVGYSRTQAAQLALTLGTTQNTYGQGDAARMAGFARVLGLGRDPGQVFASVGRVGELRGNRSVGDAEMALVMARARTMGLDQGRIGEFLQRMTGSAEEQFAATGQASLSGALGVVGLPSVIYGANDPRRSNDTALAGGLNSVMQSTPGRSFLMRAMGYGRTGGLGYVEMKKRLDAGVFDSQNVLDMFGYMNQLGLNDTAKFQAIESVAGGSLKANQIEALVSRFGNQTGLDEYAAMVNQKPEDAAKALEGVIGGGGDMITAGRSRVSEGEARSAKIENMMLEVGQTVAPVAEHLTKVGTDLVLSVNNVVQAMKDVPVVGDKIDALIMAIESATTWMREGTENAANLDERWSALTPAQKAAVLRGASETGGVYRAGAGKVMP